MDVRRVGDRECIHCAGCMDVCAEKAISLKAGGAVLRPPEGTLREDGQAKRKKLWRIVRVAALAVLCFALLWFNLLAPA